MPVAGRPRWIMGGLWSSSLTTLFGDLPRPAFGTLCEVKGIGPAKAAQLQASLEIARRFAAEELKQGQLFRSSADVFHHYQEQLGNLKKEEFHVLLLDAKNRKLKDVRVSEGSLTSSLVHPREVFTRWSGSRRLR